jgi:hypothetical protein
VCEPPNRDSAKAGFGLARRGLAEQGSYERILRLFSPSGQVTVWPIP